MSGTIPGIPADPADLQERLARERLAAEPKPGNRIGAYRLLRLLGQGTTGRVFEVEHQRIGRRAAMKTLAAEAAVRKEAVKRLFAEAMAVNRINHPHIVEITDVVEGGVHLVVDAGRESIAPQKVNALVMELLEGESLAKAMAHDGPLPAERFLPILAQVCEALAAAHAVGFVHRDLKPDNIFLIERDGQADFVKLLDFGLAKVVKVDPNKSSPSLQTLDGTFLGTPAYASPEQASGKRIGHETDIYSVGVVLYELISGHLPFQGSSIADFILQHLNAPPPPLPQDIVSTSLGRTLDAVVHRCLAKNSAERFQAAQLAEIFWSLSRGQSVRFTIREDYRSPTYITPSPRKRLGTQIAWGLGVGLTAALISAGVVSQLRGHRPRPSAATASSELAPPPAGQAAAAPAQVTVSFDSDPAGAEVRVVGNDTVLGVTPFVHRFVKQDHPIEIELRAAGYETGHLTLSLSVSRTVSATLNRSAATRRRTAPRELQRESTIDPFH
ncbi:MAG TPA: serine/threonine-protein kinase [Polyangia bacterium]